MSNNLEYSSEIKKGLISLLMFTLYSDEKTIYREYVQNALDSINKAVETGILAKQKDGVVNININKSKQNITIKDNGTGICLDKAIKTLLDISASNKDGYNQAGQFGIGRLVGGGYCHQMIFNTTAVGESQGTRITFDVDKIWAMINEDDTDYSATFVIDECTQKERFDADINDHYFEVLLNGIKEEAAPSLLNVADVVNYLNSVAPVEYQPEFKNVLMYTSCASQPDFKDLHEGLEQVQLFVNSKRIQKQYGLFITGTKDQIENLEYFKIEDSKYGFLGWGWFALTKYTIQIPKEDSLSCIRLRKHNIQIGGANQLSGSSFWKEERSNSYFYGEFFVVHRNIVPNAARDGLAPTPESNALISRLKEYFDNLKTLYTKANEAKKSIDKIKEGLERLKKYGKNDICGKDLIENKGYGKFEKLIKNAKFGPTKRMLCLYEPLYEQMKDEVEAFRNEFQKPNVSTSTDPLKIVEPLPDDKRPEAIDVTPTNITNPQNNPLHAPQYLEKADKKTEEAGNDSTVTSPSDTYQVVKDEEPNKTPTSNSPLNQGDILKTLTTILDANELCTIQRVFRVLDTYCPDNQDAQNLIMTMKTLIVKEFEK